MKHALACLATLALLLAAGCEYDKYVIEMTPQGDSCRRTLTCWREDSREDGKPPILKPLPAEELDRIAKLYGVKPAESAEAKRTFTGEFKGALPSDVGGAGTYTRFPSEMGDLFVYSERFRGEDDQAAVLSTMQYAADRLDDLLILWFESEMKQDPHWPVLRKFMEENLRQDIKNVAIYLWWSGAVGKPDPAVARTAQYLVERGYFEPQDLPLLLSIWHNKLPVEQARGMQFLRDSVAERMGLPPDAATPPALGFLADTDSVQASWRKFLGESTVYHNWLQALDLKKLGWRPGPKGTEQEKPDAKDPLGNLILPSLLLLETGPGGDRVEVKLACKTAPAHTNGTYDSAAGVVAWSENLRASPALPALCTAVWAAPDEKFQAARFGRTLLAGEDLADYVLWREALGAADAKEWTAFLDGLKPGAALAEKVKAFRFASDPMPPEKGAATSLADEPREVILKALAANDK